MVLPCNHRKTVDFSLPHSFIRRIEIKIRLEEGVQSAQVNNFTLTQQTKKHSSSICPNETEREREREEVIKKKDMDKE